MYEELGHQIQFRARENMETLQALGPSSTGGPLRANDGTGSNTGITCENGVRDSRLGSGVENLSMSITGIACENRELECQSSGSVSVSSPGTGRVSAPGDVFNVVADGLYASEAVAKDGSTDGEGTGPGSSGRLVSRRCPSAASKMGAVRASVCSRRGQNRSSHISGPLNEGITAASGKSSLGDLLKRVRAVESLPLQHAKRRRTEWPEMRISQGHSRVCTFEHVGNSSRVSLVSCVDVAVGLGAAADSGVLNDSGGTTTAERGELLQSVVA